MTKLDTIVRFGLVAIVAGVFGAACSYHVMQPAAAKPIVAPTVKPSSDPIAAAGHAYGAKLLKVYAAAWQDGARRLDSGATVEAGLAAVSKSWSTGRGNLYDATITPVLKSIVPEGTADGDVTPTQLAKMAAAFRSIAAGLSE